MRPFNRPDTDNHAWREYAISVDGVTYTVSIEAGLRALAHDLVHKAIRNKSKRTKLAHGAIVVSVKAGAA